MYQNFHTPVAEWLCGIIYHMGKRRKTETREEYNARMNEYMKKRYASIQKELIAYKLSKGCADCNWNEHHAGLQFDHVVPRNGDETKLISRMAVRGLKVVMKHIEEECEVVCSRCHSIRTWERKQTSVH